MPGWSEIFLIAFTAQLAALPGEKVQFIIAGLATRYHPAIVVSAAGTAFGLWTVLEIWFGTALKGALPASVLTALTGVLFGVFAVWLYRSAPGESTDGHAVTTDGGLIDMDGVDVTVGGYGIPEYLGGYVPIFVLMAVGEFGDKTQLVTIGLAATYGASPAIWFGEMAAIIPVSVVNAFVFHTYSPRFDERYAHLGGSLLFALFAMDSALQLLFGVSPWDVVLGAVASGILGSA